MRLTAGAKPAGLSQTNGVYVAAYRRARGEQLQVVWTDGAARQVRVSGQVAAAFDLMGNALPLSDTLAASGEPVYLSGNGLSVVAR